MLRVLTKPRRVPALLRIVPTRGAFQSRVTQDVRETISQAPVLNSLGTGKFAHNIPDYEVNAEDIVVRTNYTEQFDVHKEHPLETTVKANRRKEDIYSTLTDNQVLLTNLPNPCPFTTPDQVRIYLLEKVHKDLDVGKIKFINAVQMGGETGKLAYILVTLGSKRQAVMAKQALRKEWIGDCLVKVKINDDAQRENFNNRTIIVREIPRYLRVEHVLTLFGTKYGAVTNIELPTEATAIKDIILEQNQRVGSKADDDKVASIRQAELQIKQSLAVDQEYQQFIKDNLDETTAASVLAELHHDPTLRPPEALDQERLGSLIRLITNLQAEGQRVQERRLEVLELKQEQAEQFVNENADKLKRVLSYLEKTKNEESIVQSSDDHLAQMIKLTKGELMFAYDELLKQLDAREQLVSDRLMQSIQHFDEKEKVLMQGKDWKQETSDVGNPFESHLNTIEQFISVNQQIFDIYKYRNMSPEEVLHRLLRKELNPFIYGNFNKLDIQFANSDLAAEWKKFPLPNFFLNKSQQREKGIKTRWKHNREQDFEKILKRAKEDLEVPFEEIYHREKQVIADVIEAQKKLEARQTQMKNPLEHRLLDEKLLTPEQREQIQHLLDDSKPRFDLSASREQERALQAQIENLDSKLGMTGKYEFASTDEQRWRAMVAAGELSPSELEKLLQMRRENDTQNLGYCFITFSHADEARLMLLLNKQPQFMEDRRLEFDLKSGVDHGDLDMRYTVQRSKNDSLMLDELEGLREAKKKLREFEQGMDKMIPANARLQKFRQQFKGLIEDHEFDTRLGAEGGKMSEMDQARFDRKIKELELKYPHINFSQLYASEQAEAAKQALHKKAYASYKAFQFLKHGVKTADSAKEPQQKLSKAQQRLVDNDPYNFPMMNDTVHRLLSKDVTAPTAIDHGDRINKPGRRTKITAQEYLESHFGKDMLRQPRQQLADDDMFTFQETLKKRYPMDQFLKLPNTERALKRLEDLGLEYDYKKFPQLKMKNDGVQNLIDENQNEFYEQLFGAKRFNVQHPTDPNRNLVDDEERMMEAAVKRQREIDGGDVNLNVFRKIRQELAEEYQLQNSIGSSRRLPRIVEKFNAGQAKMARNIKIEDEEAKDEKAEAKFEASYDQEELKANLKKIGFGQQPLDEEQQRINNEFIYRETVRPSPQDALNRKLNQQLQQDYKNRSTAYKLENDAPGKFDVYSMLKKEAHIEKAGSHFGGQFTSSHRIGMDRVDDQFSKQRTGKGLQEFYEGEEIDVYEQFKRQANDLKEQKHDDLKFKLDASFHPEMPRFDGYFGSKSQGLHPFEHIANSFDQSEVRSTADDDFEKLEEEALYKRELMGRLMGQKLTPRQFEVLSGQFSSADARTERVKAIGQYQFIEKRDNVRLIEEHIEKHRRQMVQQGTWSEEESQQRTKEWLTKMVEEAVPASTQKKINRELIQLYESMRQIDNPESLFEKEYHFDEGMGVSLQDHMADLRKQYPSAQVLSRRDRDGFAIIKVQFKPEYKFDIETLTKFDQGAERDRCLQSLEEIVALATENKGLTGFVNQEKLQSEIQNIFADPRLVPDLSSYTKLSIQKLVHERVHGVYQDNNQGFISELFELLQQESGSESAKMQANALVNFQEQEVKSVVDTIFEERDRFRAEMHDQLRRRVIQYRNFTKRQDSDYILPKVNEKATHARQTALNDAHISNLETKQTEMDGRQNNQDFDKDAYYKLKEELKERKLAKERLLSQGLPQFKAYMRF